jgi:hypothetical protein
MVWFCLPACLRCSDKAFLFSLGVFEPFGHLLLINGRPQPAPLRLGIERKYRLRLTNISPNNEGMPLSSRKARIRVRWLTTAKNRTDLPPAAPAMFRITVGETYDFEFEARAQQKLALGVYLHGPKLRGNVGIGVRGQLTNSSVCVFSFIHVVQWNCYRGQDIRGVP